MTTTTATATATEPKLLRVFDVRPIDWHTGKRIPLAEVSNPPECERCGRVHAVVWTVRAVDGEIYNVGSGCAAHLLDGWKPDPVELRLARKLDRERARDEAEARRVAFVDALAEQVLATVADELRADPPVVCTGEIVLGDFDDPDDPPRSSPVIWRCGEHPDRQRCGEIWIRDRRQPLDHEIALAKRDRRDRVAAGAVDALVGDRHPHRVKCEIRRRVLELAAG